MPAENRDEVRRAIKRKEPPSYMGTFTGARRYVLETFAKTESAAMKKRVARYMISSPCPLCDGRRLRAEALSVKFARLDIAALSALPLKRVAAVVEPYAKAEALGWSKLAAKHPEKAMVTQRIAQDHYGASPGAPRSWSRLPVDRPQHADAFAGRTPAPPTRHAGALEFVWRGLCARRALGRPAPGQTPRRC